MKILKIILIVIFALLFVLSSALLAYGIIHPAAHQDKESYATGGAPSLALFEGGKATYDVTALIDDDTITPEKRAVDLMLQVAYNSINIKQFFYSARVDVESTGKWVFSDYHYTQNNTQDGVDTFKRVQAYTGGDVVKGTYVLRCYYRGQKLEDSGTIDYDFDAEEKGANPWIYVLSSGSTKSDKTKSKSAEKPYYYYSVMDFPLDFGGEDSADDDNTLPRSEAVNYSLIDPDSVVIKENEEEGYYTLTFDCLASALNASYETKYRFSDSTAKGNMENISFSKFTVTAEIWKEAGVFRTLKYTTKINATLYGKTGDSDIEKTLNFSYGDEECSVAKKIMTVKDGNGKSYFYDDLNSANKVACDAEIAALAAKKAEDATKEEDADKE